MITPLEIENKRFSRKNLNGYNPDEVDDFLDELTKDYELLYKNFNESGDKVDNLKRELEKYKNIEKTLQETLVLAQETAKSVRENAEIEAKQIIKEADLEAKESLAEIEAQIKEKRKELEDLRNQFNVYSAKQESLLLAQLEMLKNNDIGMQEE